MHRRPSSASIRNSVSTRSGTVLSSTAGGTLRSCGKNERIASAVERLEFPSERIIDGFTGELPRVSYISLEVLEPTETDVTETTRTEVDESIIGEEAKPLAPRSHSLIPIDELIERLREVNRDGEIPFQTNFEGERNETPLSIDEMTQLLQHVNHCEEELNRPAATIGLARWEQDCTKSCCREGAVLSRTETDTTDATTPSTVKQAVAHLVPPHHTPLLPLSELMDRLVRVNAESNETKMTQVLQRNDRFAVSVEEMTRILHHINCSSQVVEPVEPAWNVAYAISGKNDNFKQLVRSVDGCLPPSKVCSILRSCRSLCSRISCYSGSSWTEEECGTSSIDNMGLLMSDGNSLAVDDLFSKTDDDGSAFTLNASLHSCDSSVTWYEGSDIEEISIADEQKHYQMRISEEEVPST
jgi:hypothetical protein